MPKVILPENIQKLKEQLESGNNLVDYFFICGVSPSICANELLYKVSEEENEENLKNILKPSILCRFPEFNKTNYEIGEEIIDYCFPDGFDIIYNSSFIPNRKIFSIILDNNISSQDYPQKYLTCILFYEKLYQYKKLQQTIEKMEKNKEYNIDNEETNENINMTRAKLEEEKNMNIYRHKKIGSGALPSFNFRNTVKIKKNDLRDINFEVFADLKEAEREDKREKHIDKEFNNINTIQPMNKLKYYYIPKCICLLSIHPRIKLFQKILTHIFNYGFSQNIETPLEKIITNLIIEVPLPPRGLYSIDYNCNYEHKEIKNNLLGQSIPNNLVETGRSVTLIVGNNNDNAFIDNSEVLTLKSTENDKLLVTEIDLRKFNNSISFNCKMEVIKHMLLNSKILFFSTNLNLITDTIMSFLSLIFPFKYAFQVSSFLQKNQYQILESPTPFIVGIRQEYNKNFFEVNDIHLEDANFFVVDLDSKEENNYYLFSNEDFPSFPSKLLNTLEKEIKSLDNIIKNNMRGSGIGKGFDFLIEDNVKEYNEKYQEKFFNFFCEILRGYEEYLNRDFFNDDLVSINTLFNCEKFMKSSYHYQNDYDFYSKFVNESQLFQDFIFKNMIPKNNNELMDILIVNNYFNLQKKKKAKSNEPDDYTINSKYVVPPPKELTNEEKNEIMKNRIILSKNSQIIKQTKSKEETTIKFDYPLFPVLNFNIYCNNDNVNQYFPPLDYREEIEALNMKSISNSSLGKNINRAMEMKNYLYLTWLEIWAYTFGNNDFGEKHYRFDQMLDVLDKVIHHEMNILNLMFDILNKYKEHQMMFRLYQRLLQLNLKPSTTIFDIMSRILDKDKMKNLIDETKKNTKSNSELKFNDYNKCNNRERTFLSINDNLPLETKPKFYFEYDCITCGEKINLYLISKSFEGANTDTLWVKCGECGDYNLPKITVKFGLDFINDKSKSTSIKEYVLHSPYNLKINIKQAVNTQFRSLNKNEKIKLQISNFKAQFQPLFWDFIWYCIIHNLDYNILLPYSKTLEEEKKAHYHNPNKNIFEVKYDDLTFKDNQKKIERISNSIIKQNNEEKNKNKNFKNLQECSGVIKFQIIPKKIDMIPKNEIKEEKNEEDKKEIKKKDVDDFGFNSGKKKKLSMADFFVNVKGKLDGLKEEIQKEKQKETKKEEEEEEEDDEEEEEEEDDDEEEEK